MEKLFHFRSPNSSSSSGVAASGAGVARSASPGFTTPPAKYPSIASMVAGSASDDSEDDLGAAGSTGAQGSAKKIMNLVPGVAPGKPQGPACANGPGPVEA